MQSRILKHAGDPQGAAAAACKAEAMDLADRSACRACPGQVAEGVHTLLCDGGSCVWTAHTLLYGSVCNKIRPCVVHSLLWEDTGGNRDHVIQIARSPVILVFQILSQLTLPDDF